MLTLSLNLTEPSIFTVCAIGVGIVFAGLISIIILCKILGAVYNISEKLGDKGVEKVSQATADVTVTPVAKTAADIPNRRETVAAISAAIAEGLGTDVSAIRIVSIEKM